MTSSAEFTAPTGFRELPDGRVVVLDISEQRLVVLDAKLANAKPLSRTGSGPGEFLWPIFLIRALGDSLLLGDLGNQRLLVIDPGGKMSGQKRIGNGAVSIGSQALYTGTPVSDPLGRIVYQGANMKVSPTMQVTTDSTAPILRLNLATDATDTLAYVRVSAPGMKMSGDPSDMASMKMSVVVDPFPTIDDWALLSDGTLAVIRGSDYHIDWIAPDGKKTSSAPMPYIRVPLTDSVKQHYVDAMKKADVVVRERMAKMPAGMARPVIAQTPPDKWPEFLPALSARLAMAAPNGTLWLVAKPVKGQSSPPYAYDVIDRRGVVVEHVALPPKRIVVGFGRNSVYLMVQDADDIMHLERAPLK